MTDDARVEVVGIGALISDLTRAGGSGGPLDRASQRAADQVLAPAAITAAGAWPQISGAAAASVNVATEPYGAVLSEGDGLPYVGWVDFGGSRPQGGDRPYLAEGRYLFPAVGDAEPRTVDAMGREIQAALDAYGWTNQGANVHG